MFDVFYNEGSGYFAFSSEKQALKSALLGLNEGICYRAEEGEYSLNLGESRVQIAVAYKSANFVDAKKSMLFLFTAEGRPPVEINGKAYPSPILMEADDYLKLRDGLLSALQSQGITVIEHDEYTVV